jgi:DNA-binding response OmpR family regulator
VNPSRQPACVLVVDDDPDARSIIARHVRRAGYKVIAAESGREALQAVAKHRIDLILLDLMMPEMDGFEVCRALKRDPAAADIPIFMITARDDLDARMESMRLGISEYLTKPVTRGLLIDRIRDHLAARAATRATESALERLALGGSAEEER